MEKRTPYKNFILLTSEFVRMHELLEYFKIRKKMVFTACLGTDSAIWS